jgi:hypothetical protein
MRILVWIILAGTFGCSDDAPYHRAGADDVAVDVVADVDGTQDVLDAGAGDAEPDAAADVGAGDVLDEADSPGPDEIPPEVTLLTPENGQVVEEIFEARAEATDASGIVAVRFYVDDEPEPRAEVMDPPYMAAIISTGLDAGNHTLRAEAEDGAGNTNSDRAVFVIDAPPTVTFLAPLDGATIAGPEYEIRVRTADDVEVVRTQIFLDGEQLGLADFGGRLRWQIPYARAEHTLRAVTRDSVGQTGEATISVLVDHPAELAILLCADDCVPIPQTLEAGVVTLGASLADDVEHERASVVFTVDGEIIDEVFAPYRVDWDTRSVLPGEHVIGARAVAGEPLAETDVTVNILAPRTCAEACRVTLLCRAEVCEPNALQSPQECLFECLRDEWNIDEIVEAECAALNGPFCRGEGRELEGCDCDEFPDVTCDEACLHAGPCLGQICGFFPVELFVELCRAECMEGRVPLDIIDQMCPGVNETLCREIDFVNQLCECPDVVPDCEAACARAESECLGRICPNEVLSDELHEACVARCEDDTVPEDVLARGMCREVDELLCDAIAAVGEGCDCPAPPEGCGEACGIVGECLEGECNFPRDLLESLCIDSCEDGEFAPAEIDNLDCDGQLELACSVQPFVEQICMCPPRIEVNTGAPCQSDDDCTAQDAVAVCWTGGGFQNGYCSSVGCEASYQCGTGAVCLNPLGPPVCASRCDPFEVSTCRTGYACARIDGARGVCLPECDEDADCGQVFTCDEERGHCRL